MFNMKKKMKRKAREALGVETNKDKLVKGTKKVTNKIGSSLKKAGRKIEEKGKRL